jgi:hypothetical protein
MTTEDFAKLLPDMVISGVGSFSSGEPEESAEEIQSRVNRLRPGSQERKDLQRLHDEIEKSS